MNQRLRAGIVAGSTAAVGLLAIVAIQPSDEPTPQPASTYSGELQQLPAPVCRCGLRKPLPRETTTYERDILHGRLISCKEH